MPEFFTVDRSTGLMVGNTLSIDNDYDDRKFFPIQDVYTKKDLEDLVAELFPNGLSHHGKNYLLDTSIIMRDGSGRTMSGAPHIPMIEITFELIRRIEFPDKFSRFESVFAWETIERANNFKNKYCGGIGSVLKVDAEDYQKLDMNQLYLGGSCIGNWLYARRYWAGEQSNNPKWEILLKSPVRIIEKLG